MPGRQAAASLTSVSGEAHKVRRSALGRRAIGVVTVITSRAGREVIAGVVVTTFAVLLAVVAIGWRTQDTDESREYINEPLYGVWGGLLLLQMAGLAALGLASFGWWRELRTLNPPPPPQGRWQAFGHWSAAAAFLAFALLAPAAAMPDGYPRSYPDYQTWRVGILGAFAVAAMAVTAAALFRIRTVAQSLPEAAGDAAERFRYLWGRQRQLLGALAAMLAINVLATAVKYQMNNHFEVPEGLSKKDNLPDLPPTFVLVVGAVYGAVILAVYLPAYLATRHAGEQLAATFARTHSAETGSAWLAANAERDRYRAALGIAEGLREHFERAAGILAPLITALFAAVLPELKL